MSIKSFTENSEALLKNAGNYANTSLELMKLRILKKMSEVISVLAYRFSVLYFFVMFSLFINIGLALFLGEILNAVYLGFLIMSLFYLMLAAVFYFFRAKLINGPIGNMITGQLLEHIDIDDIIKENDKEDGQAQ